MEIKNKKIKMKLVLLSLVILSFPLISAAGVATPYWDENPLKLAPGESATVTLSLQNMVGEEDLSIKAEISEEAEDIATIIGNNQYNVPLGSEDIPVKIKIEIPKNAEVGDSYLVSVSFRQVSPGEGGMLHVASAFTSKIPIEIVSEEESELYRESSDVSYFFWILIFLLVLVIFALIFFWRRKKAKKVSKK